MRSILVPRSAILGVAPYRRRVRTTPSLKGRVNGIRPAGQKVEQPWNNGVANRRDRAQTRSRKLAPEYVQTLVNVRLC
jgi:hypothetical protein